MSSDMKLFSPKRVFFMGAGTSALAGAPTFGNFYEIAKDICENNLAESNKMLFKTVLKHWHKNLKRFLDEK